VATAQSMPHREEAVRAMMERMRDVSPEVSLAGVGGRSLHTKQPALQHNLILSCPLTCVPCERTCCGSVPALSLRSWQVLTVQALVLSGKGQSNEVR